MSQLTDLLPPRIVKKHREKEKRVVHTMASDLDNTKSRLDKAFFAIDLTSKGSNLAESSSLAIVRARLIPSWYPGGARTPPENTCATASFNLLEDRER
jgi:hypothetical protein